MNTPNSRISGTVIGRTHLSGESVWKTELHDEFYVDEAALQELVLELFYEEV